MKTCLSVKALQKSRIQEFIIEEVKLKNEAMSKTILTMQDKIDLDCGEIANLEKLIKSQVSNFKGSFLANYEPEGFCVIFMVPRLQ